MKIIFLKPKYGVGELTKKYPDKEIILLSNKSDLLKNDVKEGISLSAKEGIGIDALKAEMVKAVVGEMDLENDTIIANAKASVKF